MTPESCFRRVSVPPDACRKVRECEENGEDRFAGCDGCPIREPEYCPDLDGLSKAALLFSALWDHPAHEHYRPALWEAFAPTLAPADLLPWLRRREVIWEEREKRAIEAQEKAQEKHRHGR